MEANFISLSGPYITLCLAFCHTGPCITLDQEFLGNLECDGISNLTNVHSEQVIAMSTPSATTVRPTNCVGLKQENYCDAL